VVQTKVYTQFVHTLCSTHLLHNLIDNSGQRWRQILVFLFPAVRSNFPLWFTRLESYSPICLCYCRNKALGAQYDDPNQIIPPVYENMWILNTNLVDRFLFNKETSKKTGRWRVLTQAYPPSFKFQSQFPISKLCLWSYVFELHLSR